MVSSDQPQLNFDTVVSQVEDNTASLMPMWMENWANNLREARYGDSLDKLYARPPSEKVLIVGRGPSIFKYGHLDMVSRFGGDVLASDGALPLLAERGVVPYASMTVDGSPIIAKWFTGPTARLGGRVNAILPLTVNPKTVTEVKAIGGHIYWYIPELDSGTGKKLSSTEMLQFQTVSKRNPTGISRHNGAGNCGLSALLLARTIMRAHEIVLIGMDGGYASDTPIAQCHYHDGLLKGLGYDAKATSSLYRAYWQKDLGMSIVDPVFEVYRRIFVNIATALIQTGVRVVNCTEGGCLWAEGVEVMPFEKYLREAR